MFEKEAEEYADKDFGMYEPTDHERYAKETDWRNGAEFGYNKCKKEMKELLEEAIHLLKNSDELYGYQIRDFQLKCEPFIKEIKEND